MNNDSADGAPGPRVDDSPAPVAQPVGRRTVLRRALLTGAPVLVTLHSGPVAAKQITGGTCIKASGFISVATFRSRNPTASSICSTRTLNDWIALANGSPAPTTAEAAEFAKLLSVYAPGLSLTGYFSLKTVADVLKDSSGGSDVTVLKRIVAMLLSLQFGNASSSGGFDSGYLIGVWNNYSSNGGNYVVSGMSWNSLTTAQWLDYLMSVNA